jgi:asparagine synthase (glutamine-hydrolysing)
MCGIAGIVDFSGRRVAPGDLRSLATALRHRGPDDEGLLSRSGSRAAIGLVHRRLSIIDLSPAGRQPMFNEDGSLALVANCEIYNFKELRERLDGQHRFRSRTDSEVILHLFEERSVDSFSQLDGMFAVALWDEKAQRLVLARDPFGKKPLYSWHQGGRLAFASELPALLGLAETPRTVAEEKLGEYLTLGFVRSPDTLIRGVRRLLPGSYLVAEPDKPAALRRYMELPPVAESEATIEEAEREVERLLVAAVRKRLMADVPVGAFVSGGIDSSVIVALMGRLSRERIRTFSLGFAERSELAAAREVARTVGSIHTEILLAPPEPNTIDSVLGSHGEPFADSTALAVSTLAAAAGRQCPVVLTGDGGDEIFAGYRRFEMALSPRHHAPRGLLRTLAWPLRGKPRRALLRWSRTTTEHFIAAGAVLDPDYVVSLLRDGVAFDPGALAAGYDRRLGELNDLHGLRALLVLNQETYLADDLLPKTDRMTMAHGVEARCPFLDNALFNYAWNLPDSFKLQGGVGKRIMRRIAGRLLGETVASRPKQGFQVPMDSWLRGPWRPWAAEALLGPSRLAGLVDPRAVRRLWCSHLQGEDWSAILWSLLVLERWLRSLAKPGPTGAGRQEPGTPANAT